jgi:hypothetical protein
MSKENGSNLDDVGNYKYVLNKGNNSDLIRRVM